MTAATSDLDPFVAAVFAASTRQIVATAVHRLYADVTDAVAARRPICLISGRCCRFDEYGHRLYVTTLEMGAFTSDLRAATPPPTPMANPGGCPFQTAGKLCGAHAIRPFGCRIFFCDATAAEWQQETYERFHTRLKLLHQELDVPYYYVEWRQALAACGIG